MLDESSKLLQHSNIAKFLRHRIRKFRHFKKMVSPEWLDSYIVTLETEVSVFNLSFSFSLFLSLDIKLNKYARSLFFQHWNMITAKQQYLKEEKLNRWSPWTSLHFAWEQFPKHSTGRWRQSRVWWSCSMKRQKLEVFLTNCLTSIGYPQAK